MDELVKYTLKSSGSLEGLEKLKGKLAGNKKSLKRNGEKGIAAASMLDMRIHALGACYFLAANAATEIKDQSGFINLARTLFIQGDPQQILMAPDQFSRVAIKFAECLLIAEQPMLGVLPLKMAVDKISSQNPNLLTPVHTAFVLCSLKAKVYDFPLAVINRPIFEISPTENGLTGLDYLSYFYYAGMIHIGLKNYKKALETLELSLAVSTKALSVVQVLAYQKLILITLITSGKAYSLSSSNQLSTGIPQKLKTLSQPYIELAESFKYGLEAITKVVVANGEVYQQASCLGLVKQALSAYKRRSIRKLTDTYVTLSLDDMASRAGLENAAAAEKYVLGMIQDGEIYAKLDQKGGMLSFEEDPEQYDSKIMARELNGKIQEMFALSEKLKQVHAKIAVHPKYVERTKPKTPEEEAESNPQLKAALERSKRDQ